LFFIFILFLFLFYFYFYFSHIALDNQPTARPTEAFFYCYPGGASKATLYQLRAWCYSVPDSGLIKKFKTHPCTRVLIHFFTIGFNAQLRGSEPH